MKIVKTYVPAFILTAFGALTIFMAGSVIFDLFGIRELEGNYVLFIVWTNFVAGWIYLVAAYGFIKNIKWTFKLLLLTFIFLVTAFVGLKMHISAGGIFEEKTVKAMLFRMTVTAVMAIIAYFNIHKNRKS